MYTIEKTTSPEDPRYPWIMMLPNGDPCWFPDKETLLIALTSALDQDEIHGDSKWIDDIKIKP